jgi:hypothetical protein
MVGGGALLAGAVLLVGLPGRAALVAPRERCERYGGLPAGWRRSPTAGMIHLSGGDDYRSWGDRTANCHGPGSAGGARLGVIKGGSYLCAPGYCVRFRATARHPQELDVATSHLGFRTVLRDNAVHLIGRGPFAAF